MRRSLATLALGIGLVALPLAADTAATYKTKCAACHGQTGAGDTTMGRKLGVRSLASAEVQKQTDAQLLKIITDGKGKMPKFGTMNEAERKALVALIRTFAPKK